MVPINKPLTPYSLELSGKMKPLTPKTRGAIVYGYNWDCEALTGRHTHQISILLRIFGLK